MHCIILWREWIRQLVMAVYTVLLIIAVVLIAIDLDAHKADTHIWGWFIGGLFVLFSIPISLWGMLQHITHYTKPFLQRREIRIMWMVPIYALDAWLALRFPYAAIYLDTLRACYEAYVIYNFMTYLLAYLWETHPFLERDLMARPDIKLSTPLCFLKPWNGKQFLDRCKHGVLQYTLITPITTAIALICELCGAYHEGDFRADGAWTYLVVINSFSQTWALYCLALFYKHMVEELKPIKPLRKFLCVKFVIFLSFWQAVVIAILVAAGAFKEKTDWVVYDSDKVAAGVQDFAICIEMFFAAIAHLFAFPHHPYIDDSQQRSVGSFFQSLRHMFDVDDVTDDVRNHVRVIGKKASQTFGRVRGPGYGSSAESVPLVRYSKDSDDDDSFGVSVDYQPRDLAKDAESLNNYTEISLPTPHSDTTNEGASSSTTAAGKPTATARDDLLTFDEPAPSVDDHSRTNDSSIADSSTYQVLTGNGNIDIAEGSVS